MTASILGTGVHLPGEPIDNEQLAERFAVDARWVEQFIGTRTRHLALDLETGRVTHGVVDLATRAAEDALASAGLEARDVDILVLATATPDHLMPASVNLVADHLGLVEVETLQIQSGCAGAIQALGVAERCTMGGRTALVVGADSCAKHLDLDRDFPSLPSHELVNYVIFGDGAGAAVLRDASDDPGDPRLAAISNTFVGLGRAPGQVIHWFGGADRGSAASAVEEDYKAIEAHVPGLALDMARELLVDTGWSPDSVTHLLPPQLGGRMTDRIAAALCEELALDVETVNCVADTGNNGNALPFLQLDRLCLEMGPGDRAIGVAIESSKWIRTGLALELT